MYTQYFDENGEYRLLFVNQHMQIYRLRYSNYFLM